MGSWTRHEIMKHCVCHNILRSICTSWCKSNLVIICVGWNGSALVSMTFHKIVVKWANITQYSGIFLDMGSAESIPRMIPEYWIKQCHDLSGGTWARFWTHKRHPVPRHGGLAMGLFIISPISEGLEDIMVSYWSRLLGGVSVITEDILDGLFSNLAHTLVVINRVY